jgi:queuine tRNA-ribosyltransferase
MTAILPPDLPNAFSFSLEKETGLARAGRIRTPHGDIETPMFMPVGTVATVKSLDQQDLEKLGAQIILGNTYHLFLRPGAELIAEMGGLHRFMNWARPILTDSGGFQILSLTLIPDQAPMVKITEDGALFRSHLDGGERWMRPEDSIRVQQLLGSDIMMAFDHVVPDASGPELVKEAMERTSRWAKRCVDAWEKANRQSAHGKYQALFGIVQGATHPDLRAESLRALAQLPFDGFAVGGETIGYNMEQTVEIFQNLNAELPREKPRYAMGVGRDPQNLIDVFSVGVDVCDCVGPTRLARNGALYHGRLTEPTPEDRQKGKIASFETPYSNGRLSIQRQEFARDERVIDPDCDCATCVAGYSRAYLRHLWKAEELTYYRLASLHNVRFMVRLAEQLRTMITK